MNIEFALFILSNVFLLTEAYDYDYYDYDYDYYYYDDFDYYNDYYDYYYCNDLHSTCKGDYCTEKTAWVGLQKEVLIPETNLSHLDYYYFDVLTVSAITECTPSLGIKVQKSIIIKYSD